MSADDDPLRTLIAGFVLLGELALLVVAVGILVYAIRLVRKRRAK